VGLIAKATCADDLLTEESDWNQYTASQFYKIY
jgi:hypothetical protein